MSTFRPTRHSLLTAPGTLRVAQGGLLAGLTLATAALLLPSGAAHAATPHDPAPTVSVAAQTTAEPSPLIGRSTDLRASRDRIAPVAKRRAVPTRRVRKTVDVGPTFSGQASWYGGSFQGQHTASGEHFNTNDLTAASKTLPFGTQLRVCHDGCVVVRINDRGPYVSGRVLDLSRAAAYAIGDYGVVSVTATPIGVRTVRVVDTHRLALLRAHDRRVAAAAAVAAHEQRVLAAAAALQGASTARLDAVNAAAVTSPHGDARLGLLLGGGLLSMSSGSLLQLRRRRT